MSVLTYNFESQYLNNNHEITVILPDRKREISPKDFYLSGKKYKVLWLLHGTFGDHTDWLRKPISSFMPPKKILWWLCPPR